MKKILNSVMALAIAAMTFTACEDVPAPYDIPGGGGGGNTGSLPYTSANLNTGWTLQEVTEGAQPWSKGNSYAQATGYQAWDGGSTKSNKAVEGWLVSPAINTFGYENVKLSFNHTIRYANNVTGWEANHKVYASTDFDGTNARTATWMELSFTPVASPYSDWTLYSSGEIQLPSQLVGQQTVYIGFWFKAPANASTTWELQTFKMEEGIAQNSEEPQPTTEELGTAEAPLTVAKALEIINGYENAGASKGDAYVKGKIVSVESYNSKYSSITYYISDDGTSAKQLQVYSGKGLNGADFTSKDDLKAGATVVVKGQLKKYVSGSNITPEINQSSTIVSIEGNEGGGETPTPQPSGNLGTAEAPITVASALTITKALNSGDKTETAFVKGIITKVEKFYDQYNQIDYYIADAAGGEELMIYNGKGLNNANFTALTDLNVGDEVVVTGQLTLYKSTSEFARGNYIVSLKSNGGGDNTGGGGSDNTGGSTATSLTNGDFETWAEGLPTGWKSASTASSATLTQSTDARGGSYSVNVNGKESSNVRLGSQEITLAAGTYVFSFYAKATTADASQVRPGYVPVADGKVGTYMYGDYANVNNNGWTLVSYEFTLSSETTVCLLVMNPKKSSYSAGKDVLVDDATLVKK